MNLGLTSMMSNYSLGGLYPWNNVSYTGGLYPLNNLSYMNGLGYQSALSGLNFSTILNKAYNTEGKSYCIEFDQNGQVYKISEMDSDKQVDLSSETEVKEESGRKTYHVEQQEYHSHRFGECSWKRRLLE